MKTEEEHKVDEAKAEAAVYVVLRRGRTVLVLPAALAGKYHGAGYVFEASGDLRTAEAEALKLTTAKAHDDGGPFAAQYLGSEYVADEGGRVIGVRNVIEGGGVTIRDYFAAEAMQGLIATVDAMDALDEMGPATSGELLRSIAVRSYHLADAMLAARKAAATA
jgi:hypothetical protein